MAPPYGIIFSTGKVISSSTSTRTFFLSFPNGKQETGGWWGGEKVLECLYHPTTLDMVGGEIRGGRVKVISLRHLVEEYAVRGSSSNGGGSDSPLFSISLLFKEPKKVLFCARAFNGGRKGKVKKKKTFWKRQILKK